MFEHLATILESAMKMAIDHEEIDKISQDSSDELSKKHIFNVALSQFLNSDASKLDPELINPDSDTFEKNVIELFMESCLNTLTVHVISIDESKPDFEVIKTKLRNLMAGYYFAVMKEKNFNLDSFDIEWKYEEIQLKLTTAIKTKMQMLQQEFMTKIYTEMNVRYVTFKNLFQVNHGHISILFKGFRVYAMSLLIDQLRTFYQNLAMNPTSVEAKNAKPIFQRTLDMWSIVYKLCETECSETQLEELMPSFLEEMIHVRIENNHSIVTNPISNTLFSKFLGFILQMYYQQNMKEEENQSMDDQTQRYVMFLYRFFLSKSKRYLNQPLSTFMQALYKQFGLDFLFPTESDVDPTAIANKKMMNKRYTFDLILHLDFPQIGNQEVQDADTERKQPVSFKEDEVTLFVQMADTIFGFDLDKLNSQVLILNWFTGYKDQTNFDDYSVMYTYLMKYRIDYDGETPGEDLDSWLETTLLAPVSKKEVEGTERDKAVSVYWLMKVINMINVLSGKEYNETFNQEIPSDLKQEVITYFRRIVQREEFSQLHKSMLLIFNYYNDGVLSTDLDDDKFLYDSYDFSIECEKLPEILNTEVTITNVVFKDKEQTSPVNKDTQVPKKLDEGLNTSTNSNVEIEEISVNSSSINSTSPNNSYSSNKPSSVKTDNKIITEESPMSVITPGNTSNIITEEIISVKSSPIVVDIESEESSVKSTSSKSSSENTKAKDNIIIPIIHPKLINSPSNNSNNDTSEISEPPINKLFNESEVSIQDTNEDVEILSTSTISNNTDSNESSVKNISEKSPVKKTSPVIENNSEVSTTVKNEVIPKVIDNESLNSSEVQEIIVDDSEVSTPSPLKKKIVKEFSEDTSNSIVTEITDSEMASIENKNNKTPKVLDNDSEVLNTGETNSRPVKDLSEDTTSPIVSEITKPIVTDNKSTRSVEKLSENSSNSIVTVITESEISSPVKNVETKSIKTNLDNESESSIQSPTSENSEFNKIRNNTKTSPPNHSGDESSNNSSVNDQIIVPTDKSTKTKENSVQSNSETSEIEITSSQSSESKESNSPKNNNEDTLNTDLINKPVIEQEKIVKRKNLVYEVAGKLAPGLKNSFEMSDDIFAQIKDMQVGEDEFGNEVEYVYVQIVRKDSDCYKELLAYK